MEKLINEYKKKIKKAYNDSDIWLYVYLQSFLEKIINKYIFSKCSTISKDIHSQGLGQIIYSDILYNFPFPYEIQEYISFLEQLNSTANKIKHYSEELIDFDKESVEVILTKVECIVNILFCNNFDINDVEEDKKEEIFTFDNESIYIPFFGSYSLSGFALLKKKNPLSSNNENNVVLNVVYDIITRGYSEVKNEVILEYESKHGIIIDNIKLKTYEIYILFLLKYNFLSLDNYTINVSFEIEPIFDCAFLEVSRYINLISALMKRKTDWISFNICYSSEVPLLTDYLEILLNEGDFDGLKPFVWKSGFPKYYIDLKNDSDILKSLLKEIFGYSSFNSGQIESIVMMLNSNKNVLTILPTGWGKSLIYYFASLLIPGTSLVLTPTRILIEDQIRNLDEKYNFTNVTAVNGSVLKDNLEQYKLIYCCCSDLLDIDIYDKILSLGLSQILVDEVHTICMWSHDFRPEILSVLYSIKNDFRYLLCRCFTATATYKVIKNICDELNIDLNNVCTLDKKIGNTIDFKYVQINADKFEQDITSELMDLSKEDSGKTMVFLYDQMAQKYYKELPKILKRDSAIVNDHGTFFYEEFVSGGKQFLFANSQLGIGINLPDVKNTLHCYLPTSITQYIQEIGRSMRDKKKSKSIVLYDRIKSDFDKQAINRDVSRHQIVMNVMSETTNSFFINSLRNIIGDDFQDIREAAAICDAFVKYDYGWAKERGYLKRITSFNLNVMLQLGFIKRWYYKDGELVLKYGERSVEVNLARFVRYLKNLGYYDDIMEWKIKKVNSSYVLFETYYDWWFYEYIYYLHEQLVDSYDLFTSNLNKEEIISRLNSYLSTSVLEINELIANDDLNIESIFTYSKNDFLKLIPNIKQASLFKYDAKYDLYLFIESVYNSRLDFGYLNRFISNADKDSLSSLSLISGDIYMEIQSDKDKFQFVYEMMKTSNTVETIRNIFSKVRESDSVYNLFLLSLLNN